MNLIVVAPVESEIEEIKTVFLKSITQAFKDEGIYDKYRDEIEDECEKQLKYLNQYFKSRGKEVFYFIAKNSEGQIVGTIAFSKLSNNKLIKKHIKNIDFNEIPEISSVYVLPSEQGKGVGKKLLESLLDKMRQEGVKKFCLDGGYKKSQGFWEYNFGVPEVTLHDFYGPNLHYMIWVKELK